MIDKIQLEKSRKTEGSSHSRRSRGALSLREKGSSFIDPTARVSGLVDLGEKIYLGPFARLEAKEPFEIRLSGEDNLQDNVVVSATTRNMVVGERTSIAHGARVINSTLGDFVFVGFNAQIEDSVVEDGAMVLHGARISGVTIPKDRLVPAGAVITHEAQTTTLTPLEEANHEFKEEVISVNIELASGYGQIEVNKTGKQLVGPNPKTSWNTEYQFPKLCNDVDLALETRIIGSVQMGLDCSVGKMTSIRGDEGVPISIGNGAKIGNKVTFHALKGQSIEIADKLITGDGVVFHGALTVGQEVTVADNAVLFKSTIGSYSSIGKNAVVIGVRLAENSRVPEDALVLDQREADKYAPQEKLPL